VQAAEHACAQARADRDRHDEPDDRAGQHREHDRMQEHGAVEQSDRERDQPTPTAPPIRRFSGPRNRMPSPTTRNTIESTASIQVPGEA
jgi:hypothetical protein